MQDILDQVELIREHSAGVTRERFLEDHLLQAAVMYRITVIGEAVASIPDEVKTLHPEVPWRDIRIMRNVLAHVYFGVDYERVWDVVANRIGPLAEQLRRILPADSEPGA